MPSPLLVNRTLGAQPPGVLATEGSRHDVGWSARIGARLRLAAGSWIGLATVMLVGTALVLPRIGAQSLWLDEGLTILPAVTATSLPDLVHRVQQLDTQPPASHVVLYALAGHTRHDEFFYRLPSFVAVELGLLMLYLVVRRLWGPVVAIAVAAVAQLSPYLCFYAAEARNYGLWFLLITVSAFAALRWLDAARSGSSARAWASALALAIVNALGLWTHLFHAFVVVAETAVLAAVVVRSSPSSSRGRALTTLGCAVAVTSALFAPWLIVVARGARAGTAGVLWTRPFTPASVAYYLFAAQFGVSFGPDLRSLHVLALSAIVASHPLALALAAAALAATTITYVILVRDAVRSPERRWELLPLIAWPLLTVAGPILYAATRSFPLHPRHLMLAWPILPLVIALGLVRYPRLRPLLAVTVALELVALTNLLFVGRYAKDDERGAVRFAEQHSSRPAYVLGDVAPLYARTIEAEPKQFLAFAPDTHDVWLVDNRTWEPQNQRDRARLRRTMRAMGLQYAGGKTRFRGIVLRHWTAARG